ncbi:hypothetical protein PP753_gp11 [Dinoroseobacter phage vB_DshP-R7L]|uniref:Uncharacterized protein n=1 Tax=Dinoroseobacter phage vB_DshP-R7L TaxID=2873349 RepID=A0AAE8XBF0_9CAUD|nr:hypothetical protein PP753_gp11 [Dinoroseobacter phage vB_DshP-R7L]UAT28850.1 hypothetical protein R7L_gp11 [Dinoroseobacter phage vB_DshP-R7L]
MTVFYFKDEVGLDHQPIEDCAFYALFLDDGSGLKQPFTAIYFWKHHVIRMIKPTQGWIDFVVDGAPPASRQPHENIIEDLCKQALIDLAILNDQQTMKGMIHA